VALIFGSYRDRSGPLFCSLRNRFWSVLELVGTNQTEQKHTTIVTKPSREKRVEHFNANHNYKLPLLMSMKRVKQASEVRRL